MDETDFSKTVWLEEIDNGLVKYIKRHITINGEKFEVHVRKPDEDFKREQYPLASIYNINILRDDMRGNTKDVVVDTDEERKIVTYEEHYLPYKLFYQIDFWALKNWQLNSLLQQWYVLTQGGREFNLPVYNHDGSQMLEEDGSQRTQFCLCMQDFVRTDIVDDDNRIFRASSTYMIYAEIDGGKQYEQPMIIDVSSGINVGKFTPSEIRENS